MNRTIRTALVGDFCESVVAHQAIPIALRLAAQQSAVRVDCVWTHTASISDPDVDFRDFDGIWCVPASPYANTEGALRAIRHARIHGVPFLATCGGFQHALLEYARNVCGLVEAGHAELDPNAVLPLISRICPLVEQSGEVILTQDGLLRRIYGRERITESYHCSYGLNREHEPLLFGNGLVPAARDDAGEVRAIELIGHPFFVATLFQPERRALTGEVPPIVGAFVAAIVQKAR